MPAIYLQHPRHGTKVAIAEAEAVQDEARGWKRLAPVSPAPNPLAESLAANFDRAQESTGTLKLRRKAANGNG